VPLPEKKKEFINSYSSFKNSDVAHVDKHNRAPGAILLPFKEKEKGADPGLPKRNKTSVS